jgi:hypothetical protein
MTHNHGSMPPTRPGADAAPAPDHDARSGHGHSMWLMVACCAPMLLIALAILLGVFGSR